MSHGFYVWGSYGVMLLVMCGEVLALVLRRRAQRQRKSSEGPVRS
jgi:heme exporter protein CcmD